jgi:hypothetical protein
LGGADGHGTDQERLRVGANFAVIKDIRAESAIRSLHLDVEWPAQSLTVAGWSARVTGRGSGSC